MLNDFEVVCQAQSFWVYWLVEQELCALMFHGRLNRFLRLLQFRHSKVTSRRNKCLFHSFRYQELLQVQNYRLDPHGTAFGVTTTTTLEHQLLGKSNVATNLDSDFNVTMRVLAPNTVLFIPLALEKAISQASSPTWRLWRDNAHVGTRLKM